MLQQARRPSGARRRRRQRSRRRRRRAPAAAPRAAAWCGWQTAACTGASMRMHCMHCIAARRALACSVRAPTGRDKRTQLRRALLATMLRLPTRTLLLAGLAVRRPASMPTRPVRKPAGSRVQLTSANGKLDIDIPPAGLSSSNIGTGLFALAWNAFVAFWTVSDARALPLLQRALPCGRECARTSLAAAALRAGLADASLPSLAPLAVPCRRRHAYAQLAAPPRSPRLCRCLRLPAAGSCSPSSALPSGLPATSWQGRRWAAR